MTDFSREIFDIWQGVFLVSGRKKIPIVNTTTGERFESTQEAADSLGVSRSSVANHLRGRSRMIAGHTFQYEYLYKK